MKRLFQLTILFLILAGGMVCYSLGCSPLEVPGILLGAEASDNTQETAPENTAEPKRSATEVHGIWVATAYSIDYPSSQTTDPAALKADCDAILERIQAVGGNTIYLQVRPSADALYPSRLFPWSRYLTGTCGTAPEQDFDPLAYWVEQAHARGIRLEAWVNPYRICAGAYAESDFSSLPEDSPARQHPEWVVACDGAYYFNPGLPEVRQLICDGVE